MNSLTTTILSNYFPYNLKIIDGWGDVRPLRCYHLDDDGNGGAVFGIIPLLRPMSDILNDPKIIEDLWKIGLGHIDYITSEREHWIKTYGEEEFINKIPYGVIKYLLANHFDIYGLIDKTLAKSKNDLFKSKHSK